MRGEKLKMKSFSQTTLFLRRPLFLIPLVIIATIVTLVGVLTPSSIDGELVEGINYHITISDSVGASENLG